MSKATGESKVLRPKSHHKASGRLVADFPKLTVAEKQLLDACRQGTVLKFGDGNLPNAPSAENQIRAKFIRFLALGGDDLSPVNETGIAVHGAWIEGDIDLEACDILVRLMLASSRVSGQVVLRDSKIPAMSLEGSHVAGLSGDRARIRGGLFLRNGFKSNGEIRLLGAEIGGDLDCGGAAILPENGNSLNCDRVSVGGVVFLNKGFRATGVVRFVGAKIRGDVICQNASFESQEEFAFSCDRAHIDGSLFFRLVARVDGGISVADAEVGSLVDDLASWAMARCVTLDGFRFHRIADGPTEASKRISWLNCQGRPDLVEHFRPQPWEHLVKVLREMGHFGDARLVAIAKQEALRKAGSFRGIWRLLHFTYGWLIGYGYRPFNTFAAMALVWVFGWIAFDYADQRGWIGPSSPIIHANAQISSACSSPSGGRLTTWTICPALPNEYTTFNPALYSLDLILPLVDLQQDKDWSPIVTINGTEWSLARSTVRFFMWFEILFGWAMSLLLVAVLGNLVKKD